jgi:hypothetical protein
MIARAIVPLLSLALVACGPLQAQSQQNAADASNVIEAASSEYAAAAREAENGVMDELFDETARHCQIPAARLIREGEHYRVAFPHDLYAARDRDPTHGRMLCITHWGLEMGYDFEIVEAR